MNDEQRYKKLEARIEAIEIEQNELGGRLDEIKEKLKNVKEKVELIDGLDERIGIVEDDVQSVKYDE